MGDIGDKRFDYHSYLKGILSADLEEVVAKDISYGASWKKRGGTFAFAMLCRKWDRLEEMLGRHQEDIFMAIEATGPSGHDGTVLAEIRDLRRYLLLVEGEMLHRFDELEKE